MDSALTVAPVSTTNGSASCRYTAAPSSRAILATYNTPSLVTLICWPTLNPLALVRVKPVALTPLATVVLAVGLVTAGVSATVPSGL